MKGKTENVQKRREKMKKYKKEGKTEKVQK